jgi:hypothetical protein
MVLGVARRLPGREAQKVVDLAGHMGTGKP